MKKFLNTMFFTMLLIVIAGTGIYAGYNAINIRSNKPISNPLENAVNKAVETSPPPVDYASATTAQKNEPAILAKNAVLKFEYFNRNDGTILTKEEEIPYFLEGAGIDELTAVFGEWEIANFGTGGATLRKDVVEGINQNYLVTVVDGYIAVYYDEAIDSAKLKEVTDTPAAALPPDEQERLEAGIRIQGESSLMRLLEDLSS